MEKSYLEKSLKRFLKGKVKITLGLVVTFMITGTALFADTITGEEPLKVTNEEKNIAQDNLNMNFSNEKDENYVYSILVDANNKSDAVAKVNMEITDNFLINNINDNARGITVKNGGELNLTAKNAEITATTNGDGIAIGIDADNRPGGNSGKGGEVNITADKINITAEATDENGWAYGVRSMTRSTKLEEENVSKIILNAKDTTITAISAGEGQSNGIIAWSQGQVKINNGNVTITADNVINTRGNSLVEINADNNSQNTVNLTGDIIFEYNGENSGTTIESGVKVSLSNEQSSFTGKITPTGDAPEGKDEVTGMNLGLSNGGTWNVTGDSFVNDLTLDNGVVNITKEVEKEITVDRLHGDGGTVTFETSVVGNDIDVASGSLEIAESSETRISLGFSGITADDLVKNDIVESSFEKLQDKVTGDGAEDVTKTYFAEQGELTGKITATENSNGSINVSQEKESDLVRGMKDLATINLLTWRQEMSSLNQRMGELRDGQGEHGVWARVYAGKIENGSEYDNNYQTYQVGFDKKYSVDNGTVFVGGLVSYSKGETNYSLGEGENYSVGLGVYATWLNNDGQFADVVLKQSRLHNKFDVASDNGFNAHGDYNNWGTSLSGQYGKRFDINDKFFIEPSTQLTLGRVEDTTYTTDNGIDVHQDTMYSLIGNIGASVGYKFSEKGNVYLRTALVKEFQGDIDTEYEKSGLKVSSSEDLGDSWAEFGVGVNYRFVENANVYLDLERTGDSTVDTKWQANLGFRVEF